MSVEIIWLFGSLYWAIMWFYAILVLLSKGRNSCKSWHKIATEVTQDPGASCICEWATAAFRVQCINSAARFLCLFILGQDAVDAEYSLFTYFELKGFSNSLLLIIDVFATAMKTKFGIGFLPTFPGRSKAEETWPCSGSSISCLLPHIARCEQAELTNPWLLCDSSTLGCLQPLSKRFLFSPNRHRSV